MNKLLGANWRTSIWGFITILAGAIAVKPDLVSFLPDSWQKTVSGIAGLIFFVTGGTFVTQVKDRQVTGGSIPQTAEAVHRAEEIKTEPAPIPPPK